MEAATWQLRLFNLVGLFLLRGDLTGLNLKSWHAAAYFGAWLGKFGAVLSSVASNLTCVAANSRQLRLPSASLPWPIKADRADERGRLTRSAPSFKIAAETILR